VKSLDIVLVEAVAFDGFPHALLAADKLVVVFNAQPEGRSEEVMILGGKTPSFTISFG
jgi:hypothetical protein